MILFFSINPIYRSLYNMLMGESLVVCLTRNTMMRLICLYIWKFEKPIFLIARSWCNKRSYTKSQNRVSITYILNIFAKQNTESVRTRSRWRNRATRLEWKWFILVFIVAVFGKRSAAINQSAVLRVRRVLFCGLCGVVVWLIFSATCG